MVRSTFLVIVVPLVVLIASLPALAQEQYQQADPAGAQQPAQAQIINVFSIQGLPNESGQLDWPFAFRTLPDSADVTTLQSRINAQFLAIMIQRTSQGQSDPKLLKELRASLRDLRVRFYESKGLIPHGTYVEGSRFLRRLSAAEKMLE